MDKYEITDDLLFQHCANAENFILEQIPDEEDIDYEYPKEFEKKIKKIIKKEKSGLFLNKICLYTKKIAVVFIAFLISLFTITMSIEALRVKLFDMVKEVYEKTDR